MWSRIGICLRAFSSSCPVSLSSSAHRQHPAATLLIGVAVTAHLIGTIVALYFDPFAYALMIVVALMVLLHPRRAQLLGAKFVGNRAVFIVDLL